MAQVPFTRITGLPTKAQQEIQRNFEEIVKQLGGSALPGLVVDPAGTGDYTTITDALQALEDAGATDGTIFLLGQTSEPGNIDHTGQVTFYGLGADNYAIDATGTANWTFRDAVTAVNFNLSTKNLSCLDDWTQIGGHLGATGLSFDNLYTVGAIVSCSTLDTNDLNMAGGYFTATTVTPLAAAVLSGVDISGSGISFDFEGPGAYISGWANCDVEFIDGFAAINFHLALVNSGTVLTIQGSKNAGTVTSRSTGTQLVVNGNSNTILKSGTMAHTDAGSNNLINGFPPSGTAGGDLSGTYPNPSVVDDSHAHTAATLPAIVYDGDAAGGDLSGTYPNPSVVDDSHAHTAATVALAVSDLTDVDLTGLADGDVFSWDAGTSSWVPVTISSTPSGPAGGDLSGTYPNPSVQDDSHAHTASTLPATIVYDGDAAGGDLSGTYPNPSVQDDSHSHTTATLPATMPPSAHASSHARGGSDELDAVFKDFTMHFLMMGAS